MSKKQFPYNKQNISCLDALFFANQRIFCLVWRWLLHHHKMMQNNIHSRKTTLNEDVFSLSVGIQSWNAPSRRWTFLLGNWPAACETRTCQTVYPISNGNVTHDLGAIVHSPQEKRQPAQHEGAHDDSERPSSLVLSSPALLPHGCACNKRTPRWLRHANVEFSCNRAAIDYSSILRLKCDRFDVELRSTDEVSRNNFSRRVELSVIWSTTAMHMLHANCIWTFFLL